MEDTKLSRNELTRLAKEKYNVEFKDTVPEKVIRQFLKEETENENLRAIGKNDDEEVDDKINRYNLDDNIIAVEPIIKRMETIENVDPSIPGDIKIEKDGKLYKRWFETEGKIGSLIPIYDNWIVHIVGEQLASQVIDFDGGKIRFKKHYYIIPRIAQGKESKILYPMQAINDGYTYSSELYVTLSYEKNDKVIEEINDVCLAKIPVMLGSVLDVLRYMSPEERRQKGMCTQDPFGYFIIHSKSAVGSSEKVVLGQEKIRYGRPMIFNNKAKGEPICRLTVNAQYGPTVITLGYDQKTQVIQLSLPFMGKQKKNKKFGNSVSVFQIFREFGVNNPEKMLERVLNYTRKKWRTLVLAKLNSSLLPLNLSADATTELTKTMDFNTKNLEQLKIDVHNNILYELFPHIQSNDVGRKLETLSLMIARYAEYLAGLRPLDDRDHWGNKRIESAGRSMEQLFGKLLSTLINKIQEEINRSKLQSLDAIKQNLSTPYIENAFIDSFRSDNWGVPGLKGKENITDTLKRDNPLSVYLQVTKINVPTNRKAVQTKARMVHASQLGYVCPSHSPEGAQCLTLDTLVLLANGHYVPISEVGDQEIITIDPITLEPTNTLIKNPFQYFSADQNKKIYKLTTITGKSIKGTEDHPFLVLRNGCKAWIKMEDINVETDQVCIFSSAIVWTSLANKELSEPEMVADFTTESDYHSFVANDFVTHNCGLVKNSATTNWLTIEDNTKGAIIIEKIKQYISGVKSESKDKNESSVFWLNGVLIGWCNGEALKKLLIESRRRNELPKGTAIVLDQDNVLNVFTDGARPTRPLLIVGEDGKLVIETKNMWNANMDDLLRNGCVEYIDAYEQDYIKLAMSVSDIEEQIDTYKQAHEQQVRLLEQMNSMSKEEINFRQELKENLELVNSFLDRYRKTGKYTHCELHPSAYLGIAASMVPFANFNQGPRVVYGCSHQSQALGIYHSNHQNRFDTTAKVLSHPSAPLVTTETASLFGVNYIGENVIVAIMINGGFNQEDSIIFNRASLERGLFRIMVYKSHKTTLQDTNEEFRRPEPKKGQEHRYAALREDGLPIVGSYVKENDYIIGKVRKNESGGYDNVSTKLIIGQYGIVDSVIKTGTMVRVKIREYRQPQVGDKFASRHAQKATIGIIEEPENMPVDPNTGMVPDIIINPHCIPSRMTIGKMAEIVSGKSATLSGEYVNATTHRPFSIDLFKRKLMEYGYDQHGNHFMISGTTGKPLKCQVFMGPCYYMALKHHVQDKIQVREKGAVTRNTHQPVGGRKQGGAIKFGEMERDSVISHGATAVLQEKLCTTSDSHRSIYCETCGNPAIPSPSKNKAICKVCTPGNEKFGVCEYPYATRLFINYLSAAGFQLKFRFNKK